MNKDDSMKIPIVLMTATFNNQLLLLLQKMLGIQINSSNTFWGDHCQFRKRNIKIQIKYLNRKFLNICNQIKSSAE